MGFISKNGSMALAMLVPLACYVFIAWYSFVGSPVRHVELPRG
jgi:fucose permease